MKAAVVTGPCRIEIQQIPEPVITKDTEIKIKVISGAICNTTDNKVYATEEPEKHWPFMKFPFIIGHECSGYVVEKGSAVTGFDIGDRIVYWTVDGQAFADYLIIDTAERAVGKINENVSDDIAAIMEMVIGSARLLFSPEGQSYIKEGDRVVVYGLGPAGLIYIRLARLLGASKVIAAGRRELRLGKAVELGADKALDTSDTECLDKIIGELGEAPEVIIDATGGDIVETIVKLGTQGTKLIPYGVPPFNWKDRIQQVIDAGITPCFTNVESARHAIKYCIDWAEKGALDLMPIISHRLPIEKIGHGLDLCRRHKDETLKVIIEINPLKKRI